MGMSSYTLEFHVDLKFSMRPFCVRCCGEQGVTLYSYNLFCYDDHSCLRYIIYDWTYDEVAGNSINQRLRVWQKPILQLSTSNIMITSSNGNIFRVTGHLCGEFTGLRWIPRTKASDAELWCFLWCARLSKHSRGWSFETLSHPLWRHRNDIYGTSPRCVNTRQRFFYPNYMPMLCNTIVTHIFHRNLID